MCGTDDSRRWKPPIGAAAKAAFLAAMRAGAPRQEAAAAGGYALNSFYRVARTDLAFRAAWDEAHAVSAEAERRRRRSFVRTGHGRPSRRKVRHVRFDAARQLTFFTHLGRSCDVIAAAAEAGICPRAVYVQRRKDPAFAAKFQAALAEGYAWLDAELARQRLEAKERARGPFHFVPPVARGGAEGPGADPAAEFERVMKLLRRWERPAGREGPLGMPHSRRRRLSLDEAVEELCGRLRRLGLEKGRAQPSPNG